MSAVITDPPYYTSFEELAFNSLFQNPEIGIFLSAHDGAFIKANNRFCEMVGYSEKELSDMTLDELCHYEDLDNLEKRLVKKDKTLGWFSFITSFIPGSGEKESQHMVIVQDISARKNSETELRNAKEVLESIFETRSAMIAYLDASMNFIRVNKQYADAGSHPPEFYVGRNHFDLYPYEENEMIFRGVVETGQAISYAAKSFEYKEFPELGVTYWDWDLIPVKDSSNAVTGLIFSLVDVTERERAEAKLKKANELLEEKVKERTAELESEIAERKRIEKVLRQSEQRYRIMSENLKHAKEAAEHASNAKSEYIANMSHELRTPLNVILSALQLFELYLKGDPYSNMDKIPRHLKSMRQNCLRLLRLINNLIDTTKIDADLYELNLGNYDIVRIIKMLTLSVTGHVKSKKINMAFDSNMDRKIIALDIDIVERIILNLLSNAIKFTEPGGTIQVSLADNIDSIVISVRDDGIGIPKNKQETIFERYKQADQLLTRRHEGSGIGLSLTKSFVEMLGGEITLMSEPGFGSEFIVQLPNRLIPSIDLEQAKKYSTKNNKLVEKIIVELSDIYGIYED